MDLFLNNLFLLLHPIFRYIYQSLVIHLAFIIAWAAPLNQKPFEYLHHIWLRQKSWDGLTPKFWELRRSSICLLHLFNEDFLIICKNISSLNHSLFSLMNCILLHTLEPCAFIKMITKWYFPWVRERLRMTYIWPMRTIILTRMTKAIIPGAFCCFICYLLFLL